MKLDFIGIGPMRAGTSWLHHALSLHPGVSLPREKETFYFDRYFERGPAWYAAHFDAENPRAMRARSAPRISPQRRLSIASMTYRRMQSSL